MRELDLDKIEARVRRGMPSVPGAEMLAMVAEIRRLRAENKAQNGRLTERIEALRRSATSQLDALRTELNELRAAQNRVFADVDADYARQLCEAMDERYEPENRDEWPRTFAEMLPYVKARSDAWRDLLARIEEVDPDWLQRWRARLHHPEI